MTTFRSRVKGWDDHSVHMNEVHRQERDALRAELDEKDALIADLRSELGAARRALFALQLVSTTEQKKAARVFDGTFFEALGRVRGDAATELRDDAA